MQLTGSSVGLFHRDHRIGFVKVSGWDLYVVGEVLDEVVVHFYCGGGLLGAKVYFAKVEIGIAGEIIVGIGVGHLLEF